MTQLELSEAFQVIDQLDSFVKQVEGNNFGSRLLKGWLKELKTNVLQRSVNYAYAMDIDLVHYGFVDRVPTAVAFHELKFGERKLENNKANLQFEIANKLSIPFFFTQVLDHNRFIVRRVTESGLGKGFTMNYDQWGYWQREMSRFPKREIVLPGEDSPTNRGLSHTV